MIKVSTISIKKLKDGKLKKDLPEFYELKDVVENNAWHNDDLVFIHVLTVLEKLEDILKQASNKINSYLSRRVDSHTRKQLLFLATVFHDIAKPETFVEKNGSTLCPNHEIEGAKKVQPILDRFDLSEKEKEIVKKIIKHHGLIHQILGLKRDKLKKELDDYKKRFSDIYLELILLAMADTSGAQLQDNNPNDFSRRLDFYRKVIGHNAR